MPTICHFEVPADDVQRARKFYTELFGWTIEQYSGDGTPEYWMIGTTDVQGEQGVCGGMMKRQVPEHAITNYIDVASVDEYAAKVEQLGGKIVMPKTPVPCMGYFVVCLDSESNVFGLWETDETAQPAG